MKRKAFDQDADEIQKMVHFARWRPNSFINRFILHIR